MHGMALRRPIRQNPGGVHRFMSPVRMGESPRPLAIRDHMKPPPLASDAHPGFIRVDGVTILLQSPSDRLHDRFPAIGHLTDAAQYRAGPQPDLPFIAKPCANALDGKPWVPLHIDDAGDNLWPILHRSRHFWGKGGLCLGVAVRSDLRSAR